jgi:hypothetical protein
MKARNNGEEKKPEEKREYGCQQNNDGIFSGTQSQSMT